MYTGSKKQVMVFKGNNGGIFDEAHFIVKDNSNAAEEDMIKEANRIIAEYRNYKTTETPIKRQKGSTFWYIAGLISGFLGVICCIWVVNLIM